MKPVAAALLLPALVVAQGTEPKPKASDYPVHAALDKLSLGAEYMVHSFSGRKQTFIAKDYLVVEAALYLPKDERILVSQGHFALRINGKKSPLPAQAPSFVAASLKYPDWEHRPGVEATAGMGNAGVILGRPQQVERFPGDQRPAQTRLPRPPRAPDADNPSGQDKQPEAKAEDVVVETALPEGDLKGPVSGYLYFAYKGKVSSIRSLELIYTGPAGTAALKLQ